MVHGQLGIAESNSGKLVTLLRSKAKEIAQREGLGLVLVDGPPGIGCPAIASLTGTSYALIVTEPTLSAFHDLQRAADLTSRLGVRTGVCVNKYDINESVSSQIEAFAREAGLDLLERLPYDTAVTKAQMIGKTVMEHSDNKVVKQIRNLWLKLSGKLLDGSPGKRNATTIDIQDSHT
jgi:MinD superfamily P-loop ATPase